MSCVLFVQKSRALLRRTRRPARSAKGEIFLSASPQMRPTLAQNLNPDLCVEGAAVLALTRASMRDQPATGIPQESAHSTKKTRNLLGGRRRDHLWELRT